MSHTAVRARSLIPTWDRQLRLSLSTLVRLISPPTDDTQNQCSMNLNHKLSIQFRDSI